jgi:hypothetical protein
MTTNILYCRRVIANVPLAHMRITKVVVARTDTETRIVVRAVVSLGMDIVGDGGLIKWLEIYRRC